MKKENKTIVKWIAAAVILLIILLIIKNWDGFIDGFNAGRVVG